MTLHWSLVIEHWDFSNAIPIDEPGWVCFMAVPGLVLERVSLSPVFITPFSSEIRTGTLPFRATALLLLAGRSKSERRSPGLVETMPKTGWVLEASERSMYREPRSDMETTSPAVMLSSSTRYSSARSAPPPEPQV